MEPTLSEDTFKSEFHLFLGQHKVSINRLLDSDLKIRKRGLNEIKKLVESIESQDENEKAKLKEYWSNHLLKPLVLIYDDKVGKHRELAIEITTWLVNMFGADVQAQVIIPGILARMNKMPYPEEYEEIRIAFLELLELILEKDSSQFLSFLSEVSIMLSKIILDSNPEMKNKAALFIRSYCEKLSERWGSSMKKVVISLTENLKHQHSKVRRNSLKALESVIGCREAGEFLSEALPQLKLTINDRHHDVRRVAITVIDYWLKSMGTQIQKFENDLILFLLNGASDEIEDIRDLSIKILERHGNDMKEALIALGDEQDMAVDEQEEHKDDVSMKEE